MSRWNFMKNGQQIPLAVKVEDTLPVGTIVEYNGQNIPEGWVDIGNGKIEKQYQVIPTNAKLENGDSTSATNGYTAEYINDHSVVVSAVEPSGNARKKVWKQHSKNLLKTYDTYVDNYGISVTKNSDGSLTLSGTAIGNVFIEIGTIKIKANTNYTLSGSPSGSSNTTYFQYWNDSNLSGNRQDYGEGATISYTSSVTVPIYLAIRLGQNVTGKTFYPIIIEGTEAIEYEPYVEDKEYILNNNVYEKFEPQNEIYSTEEIRIGTWLGKPLYRKTIFFGALANNGETTVNYDSTYIIQQFNVYVKSPTSGVKFHLPVVGTNYINAFDYTPNNRIAIQTTSDRTGFTDNYVILEYTKTTD